MIKERLLPPLIAAVYWIWSRTWRLHIDESPEFLQAKQSGPIAFAHWHGDEMVVLCLGPKYKCAAMTSTSSDGELMTNVLKYFGFGISRGSSTRGGARALVGMVHLVEQGYSATVAVDGPKGPRHKPKPGIFHVAKHTGAKIIPTGVARSKALVFNKSWNKTYLPLPFSKIIVRFDPPLDINTDITGANEASLLSSLEERLHLARGIAQKQLLET